MAFVRWVDKLNKLITSLLGVVMAVMTLIVLYQVIVRFVFTTFDVYLSAPWTEELAKYLMIWIVFIGGAVAIRHAKMLAVDALVFAVPPFLGKIIKISAHIVSLIFYACIVFIGIEWVKYGLTLRAPVMQVSMGYVHVAILFGGALMILNTITLFVDAFLNKLDIREPVKNNDL